VFNYTYDTSSPPSTANNLDAARTNAFYIINSVHDLTYRYGFTEAAFNFQNDNFGKGGAGGDRVRISVQDSSGKNNANFATPAEYVYHLFSCSTLLTRNLVQRPVRFCKNVYLGLYHRKLQCVDFCFSGFTDSRFAVLQPNRDGSLENDIVVHEMTHGVTNRMTGGGTGRCLQSTEGGGMGEGWSDAMAECVIDFFAIADKLEILIFASRWTQQKSGVVVDYVMGDYVTNKPAGIRSHPYSTNPYVPIIHLTESRLTSGILSER